MTTAPEVFAVNPIVKANNTWVSASNDFLHGTDRKKKDSFKYGRSDVIFSDVTYAKRSRSDDNSQHDDNNFNSILNSGAPVGEKLTYIWNREPKPSKMGLNNRQKWELMLSVWRFGEFKTDAKQILF